MNDPTSTTSSTSTIDLDDLSPAEVHDLLGAVLARGDVAIVRVTYDATSGGVLELETREPLRLELRRRE